MSDLRQSSFENEFIFTRNDVFFSTFSFVCSPFIQNSRKRTYWSGKLKKLGADIQFSQNLHAI